MTYRYTEKDKERKRLYHLKNRDSIREKKHIRYLKNKELHKERSKESYRKRLLAENEEGKQKRLASQREKVKRYRIRHPDRSIEQHRKYRSDPMNKLKEKEYYQKNREKQLRWGWEHKLKTRYGITVQDYEQMLEDQKGTCFLCKKSPTPKRKLSIDHCHKSGKVRALLCMTCNAGLGSFKDDTKLLARAIKYLIKHNEKTTPVKS